MIYRNSKIRIRQTNTIAEREQLCDLFRNARE